MTEKQETSKGRRDAEEDEHPSQERTGETSEGEIAEWKNCLQCGELMEGKRGLCETCLGAELPRAHKEDGLALRRKNLTARGIVVAIFYGIACFLIFFGFDKGYPVLEWSVGVLVVTTLIAAAVIFGFGFADEKVDAEAVETQRSERKRERMRDRTKRPE